MAIVVEELVVTLTAKQDQFDLRMANLQRETDRRLAAVEARFNQFSTNLSNSASRAALNVRNAFVGLGTTLTVAEVANYADAWLQVRRALESTEQFFGVTVRSGEEVAAMAIRTRSELDALTKLYTKLSIAAQRLGYDEQVGAEATETFAKALKLGQAAVSEQASAIRQFSQALQSGVLRGEEFNSITENAGVILEALARRFNVGTGALRKMAEEGRITARDMVEALREVRPAVDEAFDRAPVTLAESITNLNTAVTEYVGKAGEASGVTQGMAASLQSISENLDNIVKGAVVVGAGLLIAFAGPIVTAIGGTVAALGSAAASLTTVEAISTGLFASIGAGTIATRLFGDQIEVSAAQGITLQDTIMALQEVVGPMGVAANTAAKSWTAAFGYITEAIRGVDVDMSVLVEIIKGAVNVTIGAFMFAAKMIPAVFYHVPNAIGEMMVDMANGVIQLMRDMVKNIAGVLNTIPGIKMGELIIDDIDNPFEGFGTKARASMADAGRQLGRDFINEWGAAIEGAAADTLEKALAVAKRRQMREAWAAGTTVTRTPRNQPKNEPNGEADKKSKYEREIDRIQKRTAALIAEANAIGKTAQEAERAAAMESLLSDAKASGLKITPAMLADMDKLARAYAIASTELAVLQALQRRRDDTEALQREIDLTGRYGFELHRARIEAELLAEAKKQGGTVSEARQKEIEGIAAEAAATEHLREALAEVRSTAQDVLKGYISDLREGKSATEALGNALNRIADKLLDMAANQLVEAALGGLLQGAGGAGGAARGLLSIFGFAGGGVMTQGGPRQLERFAGGGVSNRAAVFGEAGPEAAVPLPDGRRIPVELRMPDINGAARQAAATSQQAPVAVHVAPVIHLAPGVTADELARVKSELVGAMPRMVQDGLVRAFDRNQRFARSKV